MRMRWFALLALVAACGDGHSKAADAAPPDAGMAEVALIPVTANGDVRLDPATGALAPAAPAAAATKEQSR